MHTSTSTTTLALLLATAIPSPSSSAAAAAAAATTIAYEYCALIDAGSTGNRIYTYRWPARQYTISELPMRVPTTPTQCGGSYKSGSHPLASIAPDPTFIATAYAPLFAFATETLRSEACGFEGETATEVPLFLTATAGMRVLPRANRTAIMGALRIALGTGSPFVFPTDGVPPAESHARIISGEEEGVFGWITSNLLLEMAETSSHSGGRSLQDLQSGALGAMDMGGASTQITFPPKSGGIMAGLFSIDLGPSTHRPTYTHSFLYFGLKEAMKQHVRAVAASGGGADPCLPSGGSGGGTGDAALCRVDVEKMITDQRTLCRYADDEECSLLGTYQPPTAGVRFVAFSGFVYTYAFLFNATTGPLDLDEPTTGLRARADAICSMTEQDLVAYNALLVKGAQSIPAYWDEFCFNANYFYSLLKDAYRMNATGEEHTFVDVYDKVESGELSYALGAATFFVNHLPWAAAAAGSSGSASSASGGALFSFNGAPQLWFGFWIVALVGCIVSAAAAAALFALRRSRGADGRIGGLLPFQTGLGAGGYGASGKSDVSVGRNELPSSTFSLMPGQDE